MEVDAKMFWEQMEDSKVDLIFEHLQKVLLSLKQKIKDGTATNEECYQALALVKQANMADHLPLPNVNFPVEEDLQQCEPGFHHSASNETTGNLGDGCSLSMAIKNKAAPAEMATVPSALSYRDHTCSKECLAKKLWDLNKHENPLRLPIQCCFQRWHAKADLLSKSHDVIYKAPCGRSLRSFQDVQNYLFQTECSFLFLDHFSFNTYVQVFRNSPSCQAFVFDFDISKGVETVPVSFCNDVDHSRLPYFKYRKNSWPHGYFLKNFSSMFLDSCSCTDGCTDKTQCACLLLTKRNCHEASMSPRKETSHGYSYKRLDGPIPSGIYECSLSCSCDKMMCQNRLVQHGLQVRLQVFKTEKKGWGVRCLDDIDKGTFVCTYSGRLMSRNESRQAEDGDHEVEEEDAENSDGSHTLFSRKRKLDTVFSDSEIEFIHTGKESTSGKQKCLPAKAESQPSLTQNYGPTRSWSNQAIVRPKTRTSVLQSRRRQLEVADARSEEDENSVCQKSTRRRVTTVVKEGDERQSLEGEDLGELVNTVQSETNLDCHEKGRLSSGTLCSKPVLGDIGTKQCKDLFWTGNTQKGKISTGRQESTHNEDVTENEEACFKNCNKENLCLLDATREGNVGRFLNHSCCPNLFVQSVFVETHNKKFPWVAFFTNRHVKAGTELTWDYGYEAGSMPETETTCQCGALKCRKKIL
ncbi:histone-lysine N-methyltransferase SETDB2 [Hemicordylus capensis]|uniref:histone-lysine N-methyltransferase SETDB2 n=1 Tax=Hemicordylus capensis TaxID=884348 RepID=UPI002303A81C|nr:histone-lysine N-methyltransferase SETDB2 [Hemicordylus capensis]XP_053139812.1 histone-lysine N-methyltransferase SETDB2 [Hemicordylus capensis]